MLEIKVQDSTSCQNTSQGLLFPMFGVLLSSVEFKRNVLRFRPRKNYCNLKSFGTFSPRNLENRNWFRESRFGLFIHWGVYSLLGEFQSDADLFLFCP